jgi:hypothetical protein
MKLNYKKIVFILVLSCFLSVPLVAFAQSWWPLVPCGLSQGQDYTDTPWDESLPCGRCDLFRMAKNILDFILQAVTPVFAIVMFIWAGFLYVTSAGSPGKMGQAKSIFYNTFVAVGIILGAWLIANTLMNQLGISSWSTFICTPNFPFD